MGDPIPTGEICGSLELRNAMNICTLPEGHPRDFHREVRDDGQTVSIFPVTEASHEGA